MCVLWKEEGTLEGGKVTPGVMTKEEERVCVLLKLGKLCLAV